MNRLLKPKTKKLVINSHQKYGKALRHAMRSLAASGFQNWDDVIVVIGGCEENEDPKRTESYVVIKTDEDSFDYHGYNMLRKYKDHPLVEADLYIYTLDTIEFMAEFNRIFLDLSFFNPRYNIWSAGLPNCNVVAFAKEVIGMYGNMYSFGYRISKGEAVRIEGGGLRIGGQIVQNICSLSKSRVKYFDIGKKSTENNIDLYGCGKGRGYKEFPFLGIKKYIRWDSAVPKVGPDLVEDGRFFSQGGGC